VTLLVAVFEAAMWVKSLYMIKSRLETRKKEKILKSRKLYINLHLTDGLGMEFQASHGELMPERVLTSFTECDVYHLFACQGIVVDFTK